MCYGWMVVPSTYACKHALAHMQQLPCQVHHCAASMFGSLRGSLPASTANTLQQSLSQRVLAAINVLMLSRCCCVHSLFGLYIDGGSFPGAQLVLSCSCRKLE